MTKTAAKKKARENLYFEQNGKCHYCDQRVAINQGNIDHVLPRALGGTDHWDNFVFSCQPCNSKKAAKPHEQYVREKLLEFKRFLSSGAMKKYLKTNPN